MCLEEGGDLVGGRRIRDGGYAGHHAGECAGWNSLGQLVPVGGDPSPRSVTDVGWRSAVATTVPMFWGRMSVRHRSRRSSCSSALPVCAIARSAQLELGGGRLPERTPEAVADSSWHRRWLRRCRARPQRGRPAVPGTGVVEHRVSGREPEAPGPEVLTGECGEAQHHGRHLGVSRCAGDLVIDRRRSPRRCRPPSARASASR